MKEYAKILIALAQAIHGNDEAQLAESLDAQLEAIQDKKYSGLSSSPQEIFTILLKSLITYQKASQLERVLHNHARLYSNFEIPHAALVLHAIKKNSPAELKVLFQSISATNDPASITDLLNKILQIIEASKDLKTEQKSYYISCINILLNLIDKPEIDSNLKKSIKNYFLSEHVILINEKADKREALYGSGVSQTLYTKYADSISSLIAVALKNKKFTLTLSESDDTSNITLKLLGKMRAQIAFYSAPNAEDTVHFGLPRSRQLYTPLASQYRKYLFEFFNEIIPQQSPNLIQGPYFLLHSGVLGIRAGIAIELDGKQLNLTSITDHGEQSGWKHTDHTHIDVLLKHTEKLILAITKKAIDVTDEKAVADITEKIAEIHWFLAHATPFMRGSAAISEWIVRGLFEFHGLKVSWSDMADCKALIQPSKDIFSKNYTTFSTIETPSISYAAMLHAVLFKPLKSTVYIYSSPVFHAIYTKDLELLDLLLAARERDRGDMPKDELFYQNALDYAKLLNHKIIVTYLTDYMTEEGMLSKHRKTSHDAPSYEEIVITASP